MLKVKRIETPIKNMADAVLAIYQGFFVKVPNTHNVIGIGTEGNIPNFKQADHGSLIGKYVMVNELTGCLTTEYSATTLIGTIASYPSSSYAGILVEVNWWEEHLPSSKGILCWVSNQHSNPSIVTGKLAVITHVSTNEKFTDKSNNLGWDFATPVTQDELEELTLTN